MKILFYIYYSDPNQTDNNTISNAGGHVAQLEFWLLYIADGGINDKNSFKQLLVSFL